MRLSEVIEMSNLVLEHSAKGSTWKHHKYIKIVNGRYIYPSKAESEYRKNQQDAADYQRVADVGRAINSKIEKNLDNHYTGVRKMTAANVALNKNAYEKNSEVIQKYNNKSRTATVSPQALRAKQDYEIEQKKQAAKERAMRGENATSKKSSSGTPTVYDHIVVETYLDSKGNLLKNREEWEKSIADEKNLIQKGMDAIGGLINKIKSKVG